MNETPAPYVVHPGFADALAHQVVAKRIRDYGYYASRTSLAARAVLVMTDYTAIVLDSPRSLRVRRMHSEGDDFQALLRDLDFELVDSAVFDPERRQQQELSGLFHTLWTKGTATPAYKKAEWQHLLELLSKAGVEI